MLKKIKNTIKWDHTFRPSCPWEVQSFHWIQLTNPTNNYFTNFTDLVLEFNSMTCSSSLKRRIISEYSQSVLHKYLSYAFRRYIEYVNIAHKLYEPLYNFTFMVLCILFEAWKTFATGTNRNEKRNWHNFLFVFHRRKKVRPVRIAMRASKNNRIFITEWTILPISSFNYIHNVLIRQLITSREH